MAVNLIKQARFKPDTGEQSPHLLRWALVSLVVAAVTEVLVWRTFSRIGVFIPKDEPRMAGFRTFYTISVQVGTIFLNFAVLMAVVTLGLAVRRMGESGDFSGWRNRFLKAGIVASVLALVVSFALLYLVESTIFSTLLRLSLIGAFAFFGLDYWQSHPEPLSRLFIGLLAAGYIVPLVAKLLHDLLPLAGSNWQVYLYQPAVDFGELLVIANGFVAFLVYGRTGGKPNFLRHWKALLAAVLLTGGFAALTAVTVGESNIVPILTLYVLGVAMHWPWPLYGLALFFTIYTIFFNLGQSRQGALPRAAAFGLILIVCGGYIFNISDQYLFALVGVLLLARPALAEKG